MTFHTAQKTFATTLFSLTMLMTFGLPLMADTSPQQYAQWIEFDAYVAGTYAESAETSVNSAEFYWDKSGRPDSGPCYEAYKGAIIAAFFADEAARKARDIAKAAAALADEIDQICADIAYLEHLRVRTPEEEAELKRLQLLKDQLLAQMRDLQKDVNREKATALAFRYDAKAYRDAAVENCN